MTMPIGGAHHSISIDERMASLSTTPIDPECCIFKVHHNLRQINVAAYEPDLVAIGPYHRGKDHLSFMEKHKLRFLQRMLKRRDENSAERYITAMIEREERARRFYGHQFHELSKDEFVEMMLLDGCFIIELFRIQRDAILQVMVLDDSILQSVENEPAYLTPWMMFTIVRDLLLLENQLPFFILTELFKMIEGPNQQSDDAHCESTTSANKSEKNQALLGHRSETSSEHIIDFSTTHDITLGESSIVNDVSEKVSTRLIDRALVFCSIYLEFSCELNVIGSSYGPTANIKHLLDLIHKAINPLYERGIPYIQQLQKDMDKFKVKKLKGLVGPNENEGWNSIPYATDLQELGVNFVAAEKFRDDLLGSVKRKMARSIPNATELQEAGIKFKKAETGNLFNIKFNNGVMEIPPLDIGYHTESTFRNLIAYEQYSQDIKFYYVTGFASLMDFLINTPKDAELLRRNGIINNLMGDDEFVCNMFNKLCEYTFVTSFYYADITKEVNKHCHKRWNVWKAKLRHDYFNGPWALLSVLAAVLLLLLAIAQTVFSVLSYVFN